MISLKLFNTSLNVSRRIILRNLTDYGLATKPHADPLHIPVMSNEVLENLKPEPNSLFIDMTFGAGGHTKRILATSPTIRVVTLDRDEDAYQLAVELKEQYPDQVIPLLGKFSELPQLLQAQNIAPGTVDGMLYDFGCSSMQFDRAERGFALSKNGPLDMRMDKNRFPDQPTAADVLSKIDEPDLARILRVYGEEKNAKKIARAIIDMRYSLRRIETTKELADLISSLFIDEFRLDKLQRPSHMATKSFQALRIFVNDELNEINYGMIIAGKYLKVNGRLITITFHSLEDTIVKRHLVGNLIGTVANPIPLKYCSHSTIIEDNNELTQLMQSPWQQIHKHVLVPSTQEVQTNPRSRSAKLRAAVRVI